MRLSPRRVSPFLAWGDFHARSRFARCTLAEEKWGLFTDPPPGPPSERRQPRVSCEQTPPGFLP